MLENLSFFFRVQMDVEDQITKSIGIGGAKSYIVIFSTPKYKFMARLVKPKPNKLAP